MCKSHRSNQSTRCHSVEQRFDFLHHIRLVGFEREDVARLEIPQLLTLLEVLLAAARDIEHDGGVLLDFTRVHGIDERRQRNARRRIDVDAFEFVEQLAGLARHGVRGHENLAAGWLSAHRKDRP